MVQINIAVGLGKDNGEFIIQQSLWSWDTLQSLYKNNHSNPVAKKKKKTQNNNNNYKLWMRHFEAL